MLVDNYDCVVIGAGPAGSTAAALVAEAGRSVLLVEREKMPRFHVGESLMPETYWTFKRLGILSKLEPDRFTKKVGVQFVNQDGKETQPFLFELHDPNKWSQTWHVERAAFDQMLFENAAEKGADCRDETRVLDVQFHDAGNHVVSLRNADGSQADIGASVVVDATGQQSFLANRLGLKDLNPHLKKASIWGYYRGARRRGDDLSELTTILHTSDKRCWFWYIPMSQNIVSVGLVSNHEYLLKSGKKPTDVFHQQLRSCERLRERLGDAQLVGEYHVAKEFSYSTTRQAGDGWVLVGDAYGFIDPIYSSGVFLALKSGELAADCIVEGFAHGDLSANQLGKWTEGFDQGTNLIRKLVMAFYTHDFSFGSFMKQHPDQQRNLTDLLIGRVFDGEAGEIFSKMDPWLQQGYASDV